MCCKSDFILKSQIAFDLGLGSNFTDIFFVVRTRPLRETTFKNPCHRIELCLCA